MAYENVTRFVDDLLAGKRASVLRAEVEDATKGLNDDDADRAVVLVALAEGYEVTHQEARQFMNRFKQQLQTQSSKDSTGGWDMFAQQKYSFGNDWAALRALWFFADRVAPKLNQ